MYFKIFEYFIIKVFSFWELMVEESLICFGEVFCMFWVFDIIMIGVFDDIEFVDEVIIKIIWKIENLYFYFFLI